MGDVGLGRCAATFLALAMTVALVCVSSLATEHKVGGAAGWTSIGHVNYRKWSSGRHFHVGDVLVFEYRKEFHSVLRVRGRDFKSCNTRAPLAVHRSGLDRIRLRQPGHFYFICGSPGHCAADQRFHLMVTSNTP